MLKLLMIFGIGIIAGVLVKPVFDFVKKKKAKKKGLVESQAVEKRRGKEVILTAFANQKRLANDDVENLLGVSDATATRYLDELEREGKIRQVGKTGKFVYYEKI